MAAAGGRSRPSRTALLAAALGLVAGGPAGAIAAEPPDADAMLAARCADARCRAAADRFRADWAAAYARDYPAQRAVARCLLAGCEGAVAVDPAHGCAWRLLLVNRFADGRDDAGFRAGDTVDSAILETQALCGGLRRADRETAIGIARGLARDIHGRALYGTVADVIRRRRP